MSHCLIQGFSQGKDISAIIIRRTAYELGQITYMYTLVEERRVYKTLINSYVRPWASRSSPIAIGGRQRETTSTFARVYKTLINSYVRPWASRSSPIAIGGRQRETTSTFALALSTMTRQQ